MNIQHFGQCLKFVNRGTLKPSFQRAEICAAGHIRKVLLSKAAGSSKGFQSFGKGLSEVHIASYTESDMRPICTL